MIVMSINAFMKLPDKEKFEVLKIAAKGEIKFIDVEQMALDELMKKGA